MIENKDQDISSYPSSSNDKKERREDTKNLIKNYGYA